MAASDTVMRELYIKCFNMQLDELEFLSAAFSAADEFKNLDECLVQEMRVYVNESEHNSNLSVPDRLLYFTISPAEFEISFELPHLYPQLENVRIVLHSPVLNQAKEHLFKANLEKYMQTLDREEPHVYLLLNWIQDYVNDLLKRDASELDAEAALLQVTPPLMNLERLWIYSHHIKSSTKRQYILQTAKQLNLTGFSLVGKPGIICVEGLQENTQNFWREIRLLSWLKITLRKSELKTGQANDAHFRRFQGFKELMQCSIEDTNSKVEYINMREFLAFLNEHKSGYMKQDLFGIN